MPELISYVVIIYTEFREPPITGYLQTVLKLIRMVHQILVTREEFMSRSINLKVTSPEVYYILPFDMKVNSTLLIFIMELQLQMIRVR